MLSELKITSSLSSNARLLTAGLLFILSSGANAGSAGTCSYSRYSPSVDVSTKISHNRKLVEFDYMHPFLSGYDYLPFLDLKLKIDNYNSKEVNFGLGYRHNFDDKFILGSYVYFDHRNTGKDMSVSGVTVGSEFLSEYFDARANIYVPQNKRKKLNSSNKKSLEIKGHSIYLVSEGDSYESAYKGYDAEIGVPLFGFSEELNEKFGTKIYAGKYSFTAKNVKPIKGTRFRLTHTLLDYYCCQDSYNVYLTAETQSDNVRKRQNFFGIGLKVLFNDRKNRYRRKPGSLNHRMMETIIRDVDIVTNSTVKSVLSKKLYDGSNSKGGAGKLEVSKGTNFVGSSVTESEAQNLLPEIFSAQGVKKTIGEVEIYYVGDKEGISDNIVIVDKGQVVVVDEKTQTKMDQRRREGFKSPRIKQVTATPAASIKPARRSSIIKANDLEQEIQRRKQKAIISRAAQQVAALVKQAERNKLADAKARKTQDEIDARARRLLVSKAAKEAAKQAKIKANQEKRERARLKREAEAERNRLANEALDAAMAASAKREQEEQARIEAERDRLANEALDAAMAASAKREQEELRRQALEEEESRKEDAVSLVQRVFRGHLGRVVVDETRREKAATQIQSIGRMKFAKIELKNRKVEAERQEDAAVKLQAWARKSAAQSEFKKAQKLAVESQKVVRGFLARKNQENQANNATQIQKIFRGWSANTKFNNDVKDIVTVQSLARKWLAGKELAKRQEAELESQKEAKRQEAAVSLVQRVFRGHLGRVVAAEKVELDEYKDKLSLATPDPKEDAEVWFNEQEDSCVNTNLDELFDNEGFSKEKLRSIYGDFVYEKLNLDEVFKEQVEKSPEDPEISLEDTSWYEDGLARIVSKVEEEEEAAATKIQDLVRGYILRRAEERQKFGEIADSFADVLRKAISLPYFNLKEQSRVEHKRDVNEKPALDHGERLLKQDVLDMDENSSFISMIEDLGSEEVYQSAYNFEESLYAHNLPEVDSDDESDEMLDFADYASPSSHGVKAGGFDSGDEAETDCESDEE